MTLRALVRRAFPYLVIAGVGFGLAYVVVLLFVLPSPVIPSGSATVPDSPVASGLKPITAPTATDSMSLSPSETSGVPSAASPLSSDVPVVIPDLSGMALADARPVLEGMHMRIVLQYDTSSLQPENTVLRHTPAAGAQSTIGSTVTLTISHFPPPPNAAAAPGDSTLHDSMQSPRQSAPDTTHS